MSRTVMPRKGAKFFLEGGTLMFVCAVDSSTTIGPRKATNQDRVSNPRAWSEYAAEVGNEAPAGYERPTTKAPLERLVPGSPADDPPRGEVSIPADWESLPWPQLRSLASKLTPEPVLNKPQALAVVASEATRLSSETSHEPSYHRSESD